MERLAHEITRRHMEVPAILALELHKPVANINAHLAMTLSGFIAPFVGFDNFNNYSRLLATRDNIERLILSIERQREERDSPRVAFGEGE